MPSGRPGARVGPGRAWPWAWTDRERRQALRTLAGLWAQMQEEGDATLDVVERLAQDVAQQLAQDPGLTPRQMRRIVELGYPVATITLVHHPALPPAIARRLVHDPHTEPHVRTLAAWRLWQHSRDVPRGLRGRWALLCAHGVRFAVQELEELNAAQWQRLGIRAMAPLLALGSRELRLRVLAALARRPEPGQAGEDPRAAAGPGVTEAARVCPTRRSRVGQVQ